MAIIKDNDVTDGLSGMMGDVVFRIVKGKTIASRRPRKPQTQSELQQKNRNRFREATAFAKACMLDLQKKEYYWVKARKLGLPNAYTAAITDFMRKPEIEAVKHKGRRVVVTAAKAGFSLASVEVIVSDANGSILTTHKATYAYQHRNRWEAQMPVLPLPGENPEGQQTRIVAKDRAGNVDVFFMV